MHSEKGKDLVFLLMQKKGNILGRKNRFVFLGIFNVFQLDDIVLPDENHPQGKRARLLKMVISLFLMLSIMANQFFYNENRMDHKYRINLLPVLFKSFWHIFRAS
jgi:hypothetical protein